MKLPLLTGLCAGLLVACSGHRANVADNVRIRWDADPETLDPLRQPTKASSEAENLLHLSLLQVDYAKSSYSPGLADSLPRIRLVGDSLTLLTYRLRKAATWDNGQPVLATDVAFTLKLMQAPGLPNESIRTQYNFIRELRADPNDARRFTLVCQGQASDFAHTSGDFFILPEAALDARGTLRRYRLADLIGRSASAAPDTVLAALARRYAAAAPGRRPERLPGCGPYRLVSWEKDHHLRFQRKPQWWADSLKPLPAVLQARPSQIDFLIIPNEASAVLALRRGDVDLYPDVPAREFNRLRQSDKARQTLAFYTTLSHNVVTAGFNTRRPALADRRTRQALALLFDVPSLLAATQQGLGQRTVGIISPNTRCNYADSLPPLAFAPGRAVALLQQAGWRQKAATPTARWTRQGPSGTVQQLALQVRYRAEETAFETIGLQFRAAAAQLGIAVELRPTEASSLKATLQQGDFDLYIKAVQGNPYIFNFTSILHSQGVGEANLTGFGTPASDRLVEAVALAYSPTVRSRLLRKLQVLMREEMPMVPLFFENNRIVANRRLRNLCPSSMRPGYAAAAITWGPQATLQ
ncbi:ABC transporter substrate-binding protein [Hymenobacter nivis]|uniref:ABC transporter substrate-binding protein n=1 Tax=Hymenobacter nivis TaxID=1850093 RepID=A0A502H1B9_9BACT|nr:ABC transporter substrate-binding protein [Hymenobacter nivis]